jgi:putative protease
MKPEVLAPVGDLETLRVALAAGADAVYLGIDEGFNARARATNLSLAALPGAVREAHEAGARVYVTVNTLVFEHELPRVVELLVAFAEAGVDALIVQDPAICLLAHEVCPDLELHASTQMTISSPESARIAAALGVSRVVAPRELSLAEIAALRAGTDLEIEVFVHGALCMSWSGQCLTSEAWGGRSANRGQCAQSCRLPYDLVVDGQIEDLGEVRYLLSPTDLNGYEAVPELARVGVHTLKIEGRLKGPAYVATAVGGLRRWVDAIASGAHQSPAAQGQLGRDLLAMATSYSRGFTSGFLDGVNHQQLVPGRFPKSRGVGLGRVVRVAGEAVIVRREADPSGLEPAPRAGMGVGFDQGHPEQPEPGGRVAAVTPTRDGWSLTFERGLPAGVRAGDRVWITSDPENLATARRLVDAGHLGRLPVRVVVRGEAGQPLTITATHRDTTTTTTTTAPLTAARGAGLDAATLIDKLGALGGTPFTLEALDASGLGSGLFVPPAELKAARRRFVDALAARLVVPRAVREVADPIGAARARSALPELDPGPPRIVPLCRTDAQLDAVIASGLPEVELDWMERVGLAKAVRRARDAGLRVTVATVRVQKPGEETYDRHTERLQPDAVLVRHWGALAWFAEQPAGRRPVLHGDFSLNVTNSVTARFVLAQGLTTFTAAHDLDEAQLFALLGAVPPERVTVAVHHHIPAFHTEHCVYAARLSTGTSDKDCGRPCERHRVALRDPVGHDHPVLVDVACRNTVFNAAAQSAPAVANRLVAAGVRRLRVELVWESGEEAARVLDAWQRLLTGRATPAEVARQLRVHEQFGVSAGTMQVYRAGGP